MMVFHKDGRSDWSAIMGAGIAAGLLATLVQALLWAVFTDEFPALLFRDTRLTAALVMGSRVLPPPAAFDAFVMLVATLIHFALSVVYTVLLVQLVACPERFATLIGATFGIVLYAVNLHGFTVLFPWFAQARGWITLIAHVAFGMTASSAYRWLRLRNERFRSGGR